MAEYTIITNNPDVKAANLDYRDCSVMGIFEAVRDAVHMGARLISYPLSGSVKPNDTPYKSVVLTSKRGSLDFKSLQIIEDAISVLIKLKEKNRAYDESILADFRILDLDYVNSALTKYKRM